MTNVLSEAAISLSPQILSMIKDARAQRVRERGNEINVFLSHKHHDFAAADQIQKVLMRRGKTTVFMSETIEKGDSWQDRIEQQMYDSDWFILLFSGTNDVVMVQS